MHTCCVQSRTDTASQVRARALLLVRLAAGGAAGGASAALPHVPLAVPAQVALGAGASGAGCACWSDGSEEALGVAGWFISEAECTGSAVRDGEGGAGGSCSLAEAPCWLGDSGSLAAACIPARKLASRAAATLASHSALAASAMDELARQLCSARRASAAASTARLWHTAGVASLQTSEGVGGQGSRVVASVPRKDCA